MDDSAIVKWIAGIASGLVVVMLGTSYKARIDEKKSEADKTARRLDEHGRMIHEMLNKQELFQHYIDEQREMKEEFRAVRDSIVQLTTLMGGRNHD